LEEHSKSSFRVARADGSSSGVSSGGVRDAGSEDADETLAHLGANELLRFRDHVPLGREILLARRIGVEGGIIDDGRRS
jgi:hypothetical protein